MTGYWVIPALGLHATTLVAVTINLLVALDALLTECHVARAAERVFIGQPAMSHALGRLRVMFNDELLVRSGKRMEPTARARELADERPVAHLGLRDENHFRC